MSNTSAQLSLMQRVARGDESAMRETVDTYGGLIWSLARRFTSTNAEAEDAVQDIFLDLWRRAERYDPSIGAEVTFVSVLARRRLIDAWRKSSRQVKPAELTEASAAPARPAGAPALDDEAAIAARCLDELPEQQQLVLRLSIGSGWTHDMIARQTGIPLGTVKTHIRRGLAEIREQVMGLASHREVKS